VLGIQSPDEAAFDQPFERVVDGSVALQAAAFAKVL